MLGFYRVTATFHCPGPAVCPITVPPIAQCNDGDVATGGAAYRTLAIPFPIQDFPALPSPLVDPGAPTGFTTTTQVIDVGDTVFVIAICAQLS